MSGPHAEGADPVFRLQPLGGVVQRQVIPVGDAVQRRSVLVLVLGDLHRDRYETVLVEFAGGLHGLYRVRKRLPVFDVFLFLVVPVDLDPDLGASGSCEQYQKDACDDLPGGSLSAFLSAGFSAGSSACLFTGPGLRFRFRCRFGFRCRFRFGFRCGFRFGFRYRFRFRFRFRNSGSSSRRCRCLTGLCLFPGLSFLFLLRAFLCGFLLFAALFGSFGHINTRRRLSPGGCCFFCSFQSRYGIIACRYRFVFCYIF